MNKICALSLAFAALLFVVVGCGPKKRVEVEINGAATLNGEPIDFGLVQFVSPTAEGGGNVQDGQYTAKVPTGELTVRIRGYRWTGPEPEVPPTQEGAGPTVPPQRPREPITPEDMWLNSTYKITVEKAGVYDLSFTTEEK